MLQFKLHQRGMFFLEILLFSCDTHGHSAIYSELLALMEGTIHGVTVSRTSADLFTQYTMSSMKSRKSYREYCILNTMCPLNNCQLLTQYPSVHQQVFCLPWSMSCPFLVSCQILLIAPSSGPSYKNTKQYTCCYFYLQ